MDKRTALPTSWATPQLLPGFHLLEILGHTNLHSHSSVQFTIMVKPGDSIPTVELEEGGPGNKINLANEFGSGPGLIIGVPAAFSMSI